MALFLFDIDGTLVKPMGIGRGAFRKALEDAGFPAAGAEDFSYDGLLDGEIARRTLEALGLPPTPDRLAFLLDRYTFHLGREAFPPPGDYRCGGLPRLLEEASERGHFAALLTGNVRRGAEVKLRAAGLDGYFRNGGGLLGAFGDDGDRREALVPVALERCSRAAKRAFDPRETWIVGDSPRDVAAARSGGLRCAAVATGHTPAALLRRLSPDLVLGGFEEGALLFAAAEGGTV